jgi:benzylsuccinate CoA-transferase BbsF subunit
MIGEGTMPANLPFDGIKVADFSWVWVGPTTTKYLADHGATVVRVETERPPDRVRAAGPFKDNDPGTNRSHGFGDFNTSKYGLSLDLKSPQGAGVAHRLIAWADVVIESFTPGTVDDLGIGYETAQRLNPSVIMVGTCLMGQTGPAASLAGYGFHAGAIAGFYEVTGWLDLPPDGPFTAYTDAVAPRLLAATIMAAIDHRRRTGEGQYIDASQLEMSLQFLAPQIIDYNASGREVSRIGNRSDTAAPHGAYRCSVDDQWCAIAVETDEDWARLRSAVGDPAWASDSRFRTTEGRLRHHDELDEHISQWTADKSPREVMRILQSAGVPAGVVQRSSDLMRDPQLAHRNFFRYLEHPEVGKVPYTGHQFRISGYDNGPRFAPPLLGEHNDPVLRDLLGMTDDEIADVVIAGALV